MGAPRGDLWTANDATPWRDALNRYPEVIQGQGVDRLVELDLWYRGELRDQVRGRDPAHINRDELARITEWKMARGVWRARNLGLIWSNDADAVAETSADAFAQAPDPKRPVTTLARLKGVGPATASAVVAAVHPETYPFLDDIVAAQIPDLGDVRYTLTYYARYADALRARAATLGKAWSPALVERALWSHAGGKAGAAA
jgi:hypothetical protein